MQILHLPDILMVILFFVIWPVLQTTAAYIAYKIPDKYYKPDSFLFRERKWEHNGLLYEKVFAILKWKHLLPDGAAVIKGGFKKKHLIDYSETGLEKFIIETCRAEFTHLLAILPFWVFGFFSPPILIPVMFFYALVVNLPCMITQRYNRPKLVKLLNKKKERNTITIKY